MSAGWGYGCGHVCGEWSGYHCGESGLRMIELRVYALREVAGMSVGWTVFAPTESVKVWPWYGMASRRNWEGWGSTNESDCDIGHSYTDRVECEPRWDF